MKEQVATFKRADMNGDSIIKNADKQSQDLQRNREVDEILLPEVGEEMNEDNAADIVGDEPHENAGEAKTEKLPKQSINWSRNKY